MAALDGSRDDKSLTRITTFRRVDSSSFTVDSNTRLVAGTVRDPSCADIDASSRDPDDALTSDWRAKRSSRTSEGKRCENDATASRAGEISSRAVIISAKPLQLVVDQ